MLQGNFAGSLLKTMIDIGVGKYIGNNIITATYILTNKYIIHSYNSLCLLYII